MVARQPSFLLQQLWKNGPYTLATAAGLAAAVGLAAFFAAFLAFLAILLSPCQDLPGGMEYLIRKVEGHVYRESQKTSLFRRNFSPRRFRYHLPAPHELPIKIPTTNTITPPTTTWKAEERRGVSM